MKQPSLSSARCVVPATSVRRMLLHSQLVFQHQAASKNTFSSVSALETTHIKQHCLWVVWQNEKFMFSKWGFQDSPSDKTY